MIGVSFVITVLIILFLLWIILKKQYIWLALPLAVVLVVSGGIFVYQKTAPNTDLSRESLAGVKIGETIDPERIRPLENNNIYDTLVDQADLNIVVEDGKVKELATTFDTVDSSIQTPRNVGLGTNYVEVVNAYGEDYRKLSFVEEFDSGIIYSDKENNRALSFYFNNDEKGSWLSYINLIQK